MDVSLFDFDLPERAIALRPASPRDSARLLHIPATGAFIHQTVSDLPSLFGQGMCWSLTRPKFSRRLLTAKRPAREHGGGGDVTVTVNLHKLRDEDSWDAFCRPPNGCAW